MKRKILSLLVFASLAIGTTSLIGCNQNSTSGDSSSSNSFNSASLGKAKEIYCTGGPANQYNLNDIIDLSDLNIHVKYENGQEIIYYYYSSEVEISEADTSTLGQHTLVIICAGLRYEFTYEVIESKGHFNFNGGTLDGNDSTDINIINGQIDVSNVVPTYEKDGQLMQFAGWFIDKELTRRAQYVTDGYLDASSNQNFYAGYDVDYRKLYNYTIDREHGTATINSFNWDDEDHYYSTITNLVFPRTIELYPVTAIADNFIYYSMPEFDMSISMASIVSIEEISFAPGSMVKYIGKNAFDSISTLKKVIFPEGLEEIDDSAFTSTKLKGTLSFPSSLKKIGQFAFAYLNYGVTELEFAENSNLKNIESYAFTGAYSISSLNLPEGLELIGNYAFQSCDDLQYVYIPSTVTELGLHVFSDDSKITNFEVSSDSKYFCSIDGNLYNKDATTLIRYSSGKKDETFTLPSSVKRIEESAFSSYNDISFLKNINFNEGLEYIGSNAFSGLTADLNFPASLKTLDINAFKNYKGSSVSVKQENNTFGSKDGVLYSNDFKELYYVPTKLEVNDFKLLDSVEVIKSYAFTKNSNINIIHISENSNLKKIDESGINIFGMPYLYGIYIDKVEPFEIDNSAFYNYEAIGYSNPYFVFNGNNYDSYLEAWKNYEVTTAGGEVLTLLGRMTTKDILLELLEDTLTHNGYVSYNIYNIFGDTQTYSIAKDYQTFKEDYEISLSYLSLLYNCEEYDHSLDFYFSNYESIVYDSFIKYISGLTSLKANDNKSIINLKMHIDLLPEDLKVKLSSKIDAVNADYQYYLNSYKETEDLYMEILNQKLSSEVFDTKGFTKLFTKYNELGVTSFATISCVEKQWSKLLISSYINELLSFDSFNDENFERAHKLIYGESIDSLEAIRGVEVLLDLGLRTNHHIQDIYKYQEYLEKKAEFDSFMISKADAVGKMIDDFDLLAEYDANNYVEIIDTVASIEDYAQVLPDKLNKIYTIFAVYNMYYLTETNKTIDSKNLSEINRLDTIINQQLFSAFYLEGFGIDWTLDDLPYYQEFLNLEDEYTSYVNELIDDLRNQIDNFSWENEKAKEELASMTGKYKILEDNRMLDKLDLYVSDPDGDYTLLYDLTYRIILTESNIDYIVSNYSEVTKDNYFEVYKLIKSYYDSDGNVNHIGIEEQIDNLGLYDDSFEELHKINELRSLINSFYTFSN